MIRTASMSAGQILGTVDGQQVVGLDIAKSVFQSHTVDMSTGEIINIQLKRAKLLEYFANKAPCLIGIEACGGAHHWARKFKAQGHSVRLIHARAVRPFVTGNKTDATDARAIWLAIQQPGTKFVGVKTLEQQATLVLHRQRELLQKMKVMQTNALRGLLYEFGAQPSPRARTLCSVRSRRPWKRWSRTSRSTWSTAFENKRKGSRSCSRTSRRSNSDLRNGYARTRI